jgi:uncharacterized protein (TIGR02118 family)
VPEKKTVPSSNRRQMLCKLAGLPASLTATSAAFGAEAAEAASAFTIKRLSLLSRKAGLTHEDFVKHWAEIHAPLAFACPGIGRYTLTIVKSSSTRKDVAPLDAEVDGIAELWFKDRAAFDLYQSSPATKRLRDDGATFIGREIDFVTEERVIIPRQR